MRRKDTISETVLKWMSLKNLYVIDIGNYFIFKIYVKIRIKT